MVGSACQAVVAAPLCDSCTKGAEQPLLTCTRSITSWLTAPPRCCPYCVLPPPPPPPATRAAISGGRVRSAASAGMGRLSRFSMSCRERASPGMPLLPRQGLACPAPCGGASVPLCSTTWHCAAPKEPVLHSVAAPSDLLGAPLPSQRPPSASAALLTDAPAYTTCASSRQLASLAMPIDRSAKQACERALRCPAPAAAAPRRTKWCARPPRSFLCSGSLASARVCCP